MRFSDVKEQHIYNVEFEPVRDNEFNGKHLAIVLKKNNDKKTVIVIPLTTSNNGDFVNKKDLGFLGCLPSSLKHRGNSYAVFNQVRTINVNRMMALKDDNRDKVESKIDRELFIELLGLVMKDMTFYLDIDERINFFYNLSVEESTKKITSLLYDLVRLRRDKEKNKDEIINKESEIKKSLIYNNYKLKEKDSCLQEVLDEFLD